MESANAESKVIGKDVYTIVTEKIIEQLEKGAVPWQKPWYEAGIPKNLISGREYTGINHLLLAMLGYEQNYFLTFNQVTALGGRIKRGEQGHIVVFWKHEDKKAETSAAEEVPVDNVIEVEHEGRKKSVLRHFMVFNVSQCEGISQDKLPAKVELQFDPIPACESIIKNMPNCPEIRYKEQRAYYDVLRDYINMQKAKSFKSNEMYYATLLHELVHSTGHRSRLNRPSITDMAEFGSDPYSLEELIAEIGSAFLLFNAGIRSQVEQSAAYIQGWLWQLKNNKHFIFSAASQAQKAVDYILSAPDSSTK